MSEAGAQATWQVGEHVSVTYATDDECRELLTGYARQAVAAGHRAVIFVDAEDVDLARQLLAAVPAGPGQFTVLRLGVEFGGPGFDVPAMVEGLSALREQALAAGHPAIFVAGKMTWTARAGFSDADLARYEASVNRFFADATATGVCLYDTRVFGKATLAAIAAVHPGPLLRFSVAGWGAHLRLTGELDASNTAALPSILDLVGGADTVVLLDATQLRFLDAAAAGTIVRFAASRPTRHTVVRCTRGVRQALRLVGADTVPSLVLREHRSGV